MRRSIIIPEEDAMPPAPLLDRAGRPRSPATLPGYHHGRPPRNRGLHYPPDPPTVEEIIAVMRAAGEDREGIRLRGLIVVLWRAGLRISEALALAESDLDPDRGSILVRRGKGGRRREVGMDRWGFQQLAPWLEIRRELPVGALFCVVRGPTRGRPCSTPAIRVQLRDAAAKAGGAAALRPMNFGMPMPSRCRARASHWWSFSGSSGMPTSG
jgi:site-specific recombinase XerC